MTMRTCGKLLLLGTAMCWCGGTTLAEDTKGQGQESLDIKQIISTMTGGIKAGTPSDADKLPDFKKITKDMTSKKGMFTLWFYPPQAKDKDHQKLLCQIPSGLLGEKFMLSTSYSGGGFFTGFPLDQRVVQWELLGRQLLLIEPETGYVVPKGKEVSDVVRRTYPARIRVAIPIISKAPNGDRLIDLGALLKSDFADIGWMSIMDSLFGVGGGSGRINSSLSKWHRAPKTFPFNVEIMVELAVSRSSPPGSYDKKIVHYSFWKLPKSGYTPRVADDRVGYFLTTNQDWSKPNNARDTFNRYIDRWHLVKRDSSLALCEPKQPIIYYIEKTVPVRYRRAVRDGILDWNKAFEKLGFVNAVEVRQQTDDNEWKDLDPEDMRYSFFRWIVTGAAFAMGPHRANPFTGQIYDADIIFDDSMVRFFEKNVEQSLVEGAAALKVGDPAFSRFLQQFPQWRRPVRDWEYFDFGRSADLKLREAVRTRMRGRHFCDYMEGMKHQVALAHTVLIGQRKDVIDRFLYDVVKETVMHEVGHTLGLRHNFKASSVYTLAQIKERRTKGLATTGSVMDYNPALLFAEHATEGNFTTPTVGPYDNWAIEYGYRPFDASYKGKDKGKEKAKEEDSKAEASPSQIKAEDVASIQASGGGAIDPNSIPKEILDKLPPEIKKMIASGKLGQMATAMTGDGSPGGTKKPSEMVFKAAPKGEEKMLWKIASRSAEPELAYATDEDATFLSPDPRVNRFDMGDDPLAWAKSRIELVDRRMKHILTWGVKDQESWYHLRQAFASLMFEKAFAMSYVGRYVGGQYFQRNHRGDPNEQPPFVLVEPKRQRAALKFIEENLFSDPFFAIPPEVLNHLAPSRWWHRGAFVSFTMDFPIHDMIGVLQWYNLIDLLFPNTLRRIYDAELKSSSSDKITVAEYLQRIQKSCWGGATDMKRLEAVTWTDNTPFISDIRRSLQREYLGLVEPLVRQKPGRVLLPDLHAMVQYSLKMLSDDLGKVIETGKADFASQAHLVSCKSRIDRMLSPKLDEYKPNPLFNLFGARGQSSQ